MSGKTGRFLKIILSVGVVAGGTGYLLASTAGSAMEYYKHVDEVVPQRAQWAGKHLQLHGFVVPGSIKRRIENNRMEYKFQQTNCGQEIEVRYAGTVPDTFKDRAKVVIKGTLRSEVFESTEVMAKCPSKYKANTTHDSMCAVGKAN